MEIVIVPAWQRADFLHACLTRLSVADDGLAEYWICLDRGHSAEVAAVARRFAARMGNLRVRVVQRPDHPYHGNSFNVLSAYLEAVAARPTLIHLVEEDVLVGADYFRAHRQAHAIAAAVFAVSACRNQNTDLELPGDASAVYLHRSYQSLGVSFRPARLAALAEHTTDAYFRDPVGYCRRNFPASRIPDSNAEQDGLLHRLAEAAGLPTGYMSVPRAYHAGWHGYHRTGQHLAGTVEQRAARILAMNTGELNAHAGSHKDLHAIDLDGKRAALHRIVDWP